MITLLRCLIGLHAWRWYSLHDPGELRSNPHVSQCLHCNRIVGGWRGQDNQ